MAKKQPTIDYDATNRKLMMAIVTLTSTFIFAAIALYLLIGNS